MTAYRKELILGLLFVIVVILHTDWWWWSARDPILFSVLPFSMWWATVIDLLVLGIFLWWNRWGWPMPPKDFEEKSPQEQEE